MKSLSKKEINAHIDAWLAFDDLELKINPNVVSFTLQEIAERSGMPSRSMAAQASIRAIKKIRNNFFSDKI